MSLDRNRLRRYLTQAEKLLPTGERVVTVEDGIALLDALDAAEAERDEWRETALDERGAALDLLEQVKARDKRIQAVRDICDRASRDAGTLERNLLGGHRLYPKEIRRALGGDA